MTKQRFVYMIFFAATFRSQGSEKNIPHRTFFGFHKFLS